MKTVFLIRHGDKERIPGDPHLTELGKKQAFESGVFLEQFSIDKVISSPMTRTLQTTAEILKTLKLDFSEDKRLIERMIWSSYDVKKEDLMKDWFKATNNRQFKSKFGDTSFDTGARVTAVIEEVPENSTALLVTHGGATLDYLRNTFGDNALESIKTEYPGGTDFMMRHCAINKVVFTKNGPQLKMLNYNDHLSVKTE
jgi:broad specificity phosphatase PhoE